MAVPNPHRTVALPIGPQEDEVRSIGGVDVQTAVAASTRARVDQILAGAAVDQQTAVLRRISTREEDVDARGIVGHQQATAFIFTRSDEQIAEPHSAGPSGRCRPRSRLDTPTARPRRCTPATPPPLDRYLQPRPAVRQ